MPPISSSPRFLLGVVSITAGAILATFFWELRVLWFQGGTLGLVLIGLGVLDLWESEHRGGGRPSRGLLHELRDEVVGPTRGAESRRDEVPTASGEPGPKAGEDVERERENSSRRH